MIYIIHFADPFGHAQHYIGFCKIGRLHERIREHANGRGAKLLRNVLNEGILWSVARVMPGGREREKQLKYKIKSTPSYCPYCKGPRRYDIALMLLVQQLNYTLGKVYLRKGLITKKQLDWIKP